MWRAIQRSSNVQKINPFQNWIKWKLWFADLVVLITFNVFGRKALDFLMLLFETPQPVAHYCLDMNYTGVHLVISVIYGYGIYICLRDILVHTSRLSGKVWKVANFYLGLWLVFLDLEIIATKPCILKQHFPSSIHIEDFCFLKSGLIFFIYELSFQPSFK